MFILEGSNNETDNSLSAAHFELGTGEECHGAVVLMGIENASTLTLPTPNSSGIIEVSVKGLRIGRLDAIEFMGRRYTRSLREPNPGEFYWDAAIGVIRFQANFVQVAES